MLDALSAILNRWKSLPQQPAHSGFMERGLQREPTKTRGISLDEYERAVKEMEAYYSTKFDINKVYEAMSESTEMYPGRSYIRIPEGMNYSIVGYDTDRKVWTFRTIDGDFETTDFYEMAAEIANYYKVEVDADKT